MTYRGLGDPETTAVSDLSAIEVNDPSLAPLVSVGYQVGILRQQIDAELDNVADATASVDWNQLASDLNTMTGLESQLATLIQQRLAEVAATPNAQEAAILNNWLAFAIQWGESTVAAIPQGIIDGATDALNAVTTALGNVLGNAGGSLAKASIPYFAIAAGVVALLLFAETSSTVRTVAPKLLRAG